jgi:hypothetical protein
MHAKTILKGFWQLGSIVKIVAFQALGIFFLAYSAGLLAMAVGVRGCPPRPEFNNWYLWLVLVAGSSSFLISIFYIIKPSVWMHRISRYLVLAPTDVNLPTFSTHPLYVFVDALFFIPGIALFQGGRTETLCQLNSEWAMGIAALGLALFFPVFRVICWFGLGLQIEAMTLKKPWMPVVWWYIFALPLFIYFTYTYMDNTVFPRLRVPVVNEMTFQGGLDKNPEFNGKLVRVQGKLVRKIAKCGLFGKDPEKFRYPYGTVLLDLGKKNGQIMVQVKKPSQVEELEIEAENRMGKVFEAFGYLSILPNPKKRLICGIGKADSEQKGGLALLEVEMPE